MNKPSPIPHDPQLAERLKRAEREIIDLREQLEHHQRLATLGTVAASAAHEINNILTPVLAYAQLAAAHPDDTALKSKVVDKAIGGVEAATQIAHAMLGFAATADRSAVAVVSEAFRNALDCIGRQPGHQRVRLATNFHAGDCVCMRPLALQQVFMNLLLNAFAALSGRTGEIVVESTLRPDGIVMIRVSDTGPGIPPDIAARLFEPFVSSKPGATPSPGRSGAAANGSRGCQGGSGLGLSICRQTIQAAGGTISANSAPGKGTTFTISLPAGRVQHAKAG